MVVLGAGNWVKEQYAKALQPYRQRKECGVFIIYDTGYASAIGFTGAEADRYNKFTLDNVKGFTSWGASCLDLANPAQRDKIAGLSPYVVFVATPDNTHCDMVEQWLDRAENLIVEKPFDVDHERIRRLRSEMARRGSPTKVWGFDHYLMRANQFVKMKQHLGFDEHLEGQIHEFRFHMLESQDRGLEERAASVQAGLIMDMGSHTLALVLPFGDPNTIRLDAVKAGVYKPNPEKCIITSGRHLLKSGMETFAEIQFTFTSVFGQAVKATACVGKCVGEQDEKYVEVIGGQNRDRTVRLDLSSYIVDFIGGKNPGPVTSLFSNPVYLLVREVIAGSHSGSLALFKPEVGQDIVARLNEWRRPIIDQVRGGLPLEEYPARKSLEKVLDTLKPCESAGPTMDGTQSPERKTSSPTLVQIQIRQTAGKTFVEKVREIQEVTEVFLNYEQPTVHFWTVISAQHKDIRPKVYECELAVIQQFPEFEYDFHVLSGSQKAIAEQLSLQAERIFWRNTHDAL